MQEKIAPDIAQVYRLLLKQLPCSIWTTDKDLRFTSSAGNGFALIGLKPDHVIGLTVEEFYQGRAKKEEALAAHRRALQSEEATYESAYHEKMFIAFVKPLLNEKHEIIGTLGLALDITEQKRMQMVLEQVNRKLSLLNSITQHDAKNKISALKSYLCLVQEDVIDPALCRYFETIDSIVDDLTEQIEFTREYQNLGMKRPQWQDITLIIHNLKTGPICINTDIDGLKLYADPLLGKVFYNLLDNAIRHGEHVTTVSITARENEEGLILVWEDDGIGIPREDKDKIFDRGFGKNTGLGLFLIREILSITGITIQENGTPGEGARFGIRVPKGAYGFNQTNPPVHNLNR